jgi:YfiH family protein
VLRQDAEGLTTYQFENLGFDPLVHAVFTRLGGVSQAPFDTLNVGHRVGDDEEAVAVNHGRIYARLDLKAECIATPGQVHSNRVAVVTAGDEGQLIPSTDGLVTDVPGVALLLRFADCQPIFLYDPANSALGLIHAGWRGVALAIARRAVETMQEAFDTRPQDLVAGLGPAIGPCCYVVGRNVAAAMGYALPNWNKAMSPEGSRWRLDLSAANAQQLAAAGVRNIEQAHLCTSCNNHEFFSHRADNGHTGRFAAVAYLRPASGSRVPRRKARKHGDTPVADSPQADALQPPGLPTFQELLGGHR